MAANLDNTPLRERITTAERFVRELKEHLEQSFIPKASELRKQLKASEGTEETLSDNVVRELVDKVFESDEFTHDLYKQLEQYLASIRAETGKMVGDV